MRVWQPGALPDQAAEQLKNSSATLVPRRNLVRGLFWPLLALIACAAIWWITTSRANAEWDRASAAVTKDAAAYAEAYEQYVTRSIGQMDTRTIGIIRYHARDGFVCRRTGFRDGMKLNRMRVESND